MSSPAQTPRIVVTGANGNLGRRLIGSLQSLEREPHIKAVVRSERAAQQLSDFQSLECHVVDYTDAQALTPVLQDCDVVVHLVGILKETQSNTYQQAHEATCEALLQALQGASGTPRIVYLSILGSEPNSQNACLRSKGCAEQLLIDSERPVTVLQVPMVLGEGDYATQALQRRARQNVSVTIRAASLEQPIFADDVVQAILAGTEVAFDRVQLAGPEAVTRRALYKRAAAAVGRETRVISIPAGFGYAFAWLMERISANPPLTSAMLGVLDHDDHVDSSTASARLGIELTSLENMLQRLLKP